MALKAQITAIVPKKYRDSTDLFEYSSLDDFEAKIRRLNEQTSAYFILEALAIYSFLWDAELYAASGLTWKKYKAESGKRLGLNKREFYDFFHAGLFLSKYGKQLFAAGFDPVRSNRKLARADHALKVCGDPEQVIDHLVTDQWDEFKTWYSSLKALAEPGEVKQQAKREIAIVDGKVLINGREPVRIARSVTSKERKDIERLIADYFKGKVK